MELVIKIDKNTLNDAKNGHIRLVQIANAILSGTPLPEGHGDLIDKDHFEKLLRDYGLDYEADTFIPMATTVIKADK